MEIDPKILSRLIKEAVTEHSGGIKFTELITSVTSKLHEQESIKEVDAKTFPDLLEKTIYGIKGLNILHYSMRMGDIWRGKMFVYQTIE